MIDSLRGPRAVGIGLYLLAALPRIAYVFLLAWSVREGFAGEMERAAVSIVSEGTLGNVYGPGTGPSAHVAPLYPYWLAGWFSLSGVQTFHRVLMEGILAALVTSLCIACLPSLARQLRLSVGAATVASVILALSPLNLWIECRGGWEQPYAALALIALLSVFVRLRDQAWQPLWLLVAGGLLVGLAALLSPVVLPVVGIILATELASARGERWQLLPKFGLTVGVAILCIAPWTIRNWKVLGGFVPIRSNFGLELACGNHDAANGKTYSTHSEDPSCLVPCHPYSSPAAKARLLEVGELAYMREVQQQAVAWIAEHPGRFLQLTLNRAWFYWFPPAHMWPPSDSNRWIKSAFFSLVSVGCFGWLGLVFWRRDRLRWFYLAVIVGPSLTYLLTHVDSRYRYPTVALGVFVACQLAAQLAPPLRWGGWFRFQAKRNHLQDQGSSIGG
jgi:hypothetical protein